MNPEPRPGGFLREETESASTNSPTNLPPEDRWIDPRGNLSPADSAHGRPLAGAQEDLKPLLSLCRAGRLYAVEDWIRSAKPLQGPPGQAGRSCRTALQIAIDARFHDLALLLLCNGYQLELEPRNPLDQALELRVWDLVDLLLRWGANPRTVTPSTVLETYQSELMQRFWELGVDYAKEHALAECLASNTRNRPAYGWARRHRDDPRIARELAIALGDAVFEEREKAVHLVLWAGADPHLPVPILRWASETDETDSESHYSAVQTAVHFGKGSVLPLLKPDRKRDNFDSLWAYVSDSESVDHLAALAPPNDWSPTILHCIRDMAFDLAGRLGQRDWRAKHCLERIANPHGGMLTALPQEELRYLRGSVLKMRDSYDFRWLVEWLQNPKHCSPAIYTEIVRTPAMQARIASLGIREKRYPRTALDRSTSKRSPRDSPSSSSPP